MKGMILAGGLSTRLYPLTLELPKPLVPVLDRPVVAHVLDYLKRGGVDDVIVNVHYHPEAVQDFIGDGSAWNISVEYLHEPELMGSAGAVRTVSQRFDQTFVVIGCDDVTDIDLPQALAFHKACRAEATIVLAEVAEVSQYGAVIIDKNGRITEFQEKPPKGTERSHLANTGVYIFEPALLQRIPANTFYDFGKQVFPELLAARGQFYGIAQKRYWCDIGTPSEYRRAHFDALQGRIGLQPPQDAVLKNEVLVGAGARIAPTARIHGPACIGAGCVVEDGAQITRSILWSEVVIGKNARVTDAVLASGASAEENTVIAGGEYGARMAIRHDSKKN